ncbi:MAG: hypothetical protein ACOYT8_05570 [Candidatus Dependentiae bacterium]
MLVKKYNALAMCLITGSIFGMENNFSKPARIVSEGPLQRLRPAALREEKIVFYLAKNFIESAENSTQARTYLKNFSGVNKFVHDTIKNHKEELKEISKNAIEHIYEKFANHTELLTGDYTNPIIKKTASKIIKAQHSNLNATAFFFLAPDDAHNRALLKNIQHIFDEANTQVTAKSISDIVTTLDWAVNARSDTELSYTLLGALRKFGPQCKEDEELRARYVDIVKASQKDPYNDYITKPLYVVGEELFGEQLYTTVGLRSHSSIIDVYIELHKDTRVKQIITDAIQEAYNC